MTLVIENNGYAFLIRFNVFYVFMEKVPIIKNFKGPIYQIFSSTNLMWK